MNTVEYFLLISPMLNSYIFNIGFFLCLLSIVGISVSPTRNSNNGDIINRGMFFITCLLFCGIFLMFVSGLFLNNKQIEIYRKNIQKDHLYCRCSKDNNASIKN